MSIGGGMAKARVGFSLGQDYIKKFHNFQLNYQKKSENLRGAF